MRERRNIMFPKMRSLREEHQGDGTKVHLSRDKLTINNVPVPSPFRANPLSDVLPGEQTPLPYDALLHSEVVEYSRSYSKAMCAGKVHPRSQSRTCCSIPRTECGKSAPCDVCILCAQQIFQMTVSLEMMMMVNMVPVRCF